MEINKDKLLQSFDYWCLYAVFFSLEQTVAKLTRFFLLEFGENKELSYGRCKKQKSYNELFDNLKNLE